MTMFSMGVAIPSCNAAGVCGGVGGQRIRVSCQGDRRRELASRRLDAQLRSARGECVDCVELPLLLEAVSVLPDGLLVPVLVDDVVAVLLIVLLVPVEAVPEVPVLLLP
jgi:hypothetical protein